TDHVPSYGWDGPCGWTVRGWLRLGQGPTWASIWVVTRVSGVVTQSPSRTAVTWAVPVRSPTTTAPALLPAVSNVPATVAVPPVVGRRRTNSPAPASWVQLAVSWMVTAKSPGPVTVLP